MKKTFFNFNPKMAGLVLGVATIVKISGQDLGGGTTVTTYSETFQASYGGSGDDGGNFNDLYYCDLKVLPNGFIFGGESNSPIGGNRTAPSKGGYDFWVIKTDLLGNKIWDKAYGGSGNDRLTQIFPTSDGGYLLAGESESGISGDKTKTLFGPNDAWFIKIDANGNKLWDQSYGGNPYILGSGGESVARNIFEVNGKYYIGVSSGSTISGNKTVPSEGGADYGIIALNALNGNIVFEKGYGGNDDDDLHSIYVKSDGSFVLFGSSKSDIGGNKTTAALGDWDYWVISCNANGTKLWDKSYGGFLKDFLTDARVIKRSNGTNFFVLGGESNSQEDVIGQKSQDPHGFSTDIWLIAIETNGTKIWDYTYGGTDFEAMTSIEVRRKVGPYLFSPSYDDQIIVSGYSNSDAYAATNGYKTDNNMGPSDGWVVFINPANGLQFKDISLGGNGDDATMVTKAITKDIVKNDIDYVSLCFTATGINGVKTTPSFGSYDMWVRGLAKRTNTFGTSQLSKNNTENIEQNVSVNLYPTILKNGYPINILLDCPTSNDELTTFNANVYNMSGEMVFTSKLTNDQPNSIATKFPSAGIYLINITDQNNQVIHQQKINVIK